MKRAYVMGVLFGLCVMGCGEDTEPGQVADAGVDQGSDVGVEQDAGADASPDLPPDAGMCEAQTLCLPGQCGVIDDGCGGMLECQPCLCKDGEPLVPSCGTCDLGTISCDMGDRYPSCVQPELPAGVQLDCANVVYFDPTATETGMGSREVPYKSLDEALGRVNALGGGAVIWGGDGELEYGKEFEIPESVLLLGGFDAGTFAYNPAKKPTLLLVPSQPTNGSHCAPAPRAARRCCITCVWRCAAAFRG
jgi:hypothetical protein